MPRAWRRFIEESGGGLRPTGAMFPHIGGTNKRVDTFGPNGEPPGSDYDRLRDQHLDPHGVEAAILTFDLGDEPGHPNPALGVAIAKAANDWTIERWLDRGDARLYGSIMCATQSPDEVAKEIRRVGGHPRMVEVLIGFHGLGLPLGHPAYHQIFEAAAELGLPVAIHVGGDKRAVNSVACGAPGTRLELHALSNQPVQHDLLSMITHGVFEKYPGLRVISVEAGVAWIPWFLWRIDSVYDMLRQESPWVRRPPSEYVREHVSFTTQPLEVGLPDQALIELLGSIEGIEDLLLFSSDYPHWDADDPRAAARAFPPEWRAKVMYENARTAYRLALEPSAA
jgi:hypothetical protein